MFSLIYDEATAIKVAREEGREEGLEKGREEGFEEGLDLSVEIIEEIFKQTPAEEIAKKYKTTIQKVNQLKSIIMRASA